MWTMRKVIIVAAVLVLGGICLILLKNNMRGPLVVSGVLEGDQIRVGSRVGGRIAEVLVDEGDKVKDGTPLFRLEPFDLKEKLSMAEADEKAAQAEFDRLKAGYRPEEIAEAQARRDQLAAKLDLLKAGPRQQEIDESAQQLAVEEAKLNLAKIQAERIGGLENKNVASTLEGDNARCDLLVAKGKVEAAQRHLDMLKEGYRKEEIAAAQGSLAEAEAIYVLRKNGYREEEIRRAEATLLSARANRAAVAEQVKELTVVSPAECYVESIDLRPGDLVAANEPCVSLMDLSRLRVRAFVPESRLSLAKLGTNVPLRIDSLPGREFEGEVTYVATEGEFTPRNIQTPDERSKQVFRIMISVQKDRETLRPGMICDVILER